MLALLKVWACRGHGGRMIVIMPGMTITPAPLAINAERLLGRLVRYTKVETTADPSSTAYPSSEGQRRLGSLLAAELESMGAADVRQDKHGLVYATVPASGESTRSCAAVALIAHVDTSPEAEGRNVQPVVIRNYDGLPITLEAGQILHPPSVDDRDDWRGKTLIVTDGRTLLGGDDKCGVAIMMELANTLIERTDLTHGPIKLVMTCDEEIGRGTDKIDVASLGAIAGYTIDGGSRGMIDVETFSADSLSVTFIGRNIHPAIAKGEMVNSLRLASDFVAALPRDRQTPETTDGRDGFVHPHTIKGGVGKSSVELILRSFDELQLDDLAAMVIDYAESAVADVDGASVEIVRHRQYRNLGEGLAKLPEVVEHAEAAFERLGRPCRREIVRGGTDGSQLTEKGLPTPNLSSGQYNIHSTEEFACLEDMIEATEHLVVLLDIWSQTSTS